MFLDIPYRQSFSSVNFVKSKCQLCKEIQGCLGHRVFELDTATLNHPMGAACAPLAPNTDLLKCPPHGIHHCHQGLGGKSELLGHDLHVQIHG